MPVITRLMKKNMKKTEFKIVLVGEPGSGKTTFLKRHLTGEFENKYIPTTSRTHVYPLLFNTTLGEVRFNIWDTGGIGKLTDHYHGADAAIILTIFDTFFKASSFHLPEVPTLLVANKIEVEEFKKIRKFHKNAIKISVKKNYNLQEPFLQLLRKLLDSPTLEILENNPIEPPTAEVDF